MPDDDLAPEFDDDPEGEDSGNGARPNDDADDEAAVEAAWKEFAQSSPIQRAILIAHHVRLRMQELAAIMHLSGLYDVPAEAIRALHLEYGVPTLERVFRAAGPRCEELAALPLAARRAWWKCRFLRFARDRVRAQKRAGVLQADFELPEDRFHQYAAEFLGDYERAARAVEEFSAITGVTDDDIDRLMFDLVGDTPSQ